MAEDGIVTVRRSTLGIMRALVREPLSALPPEVYCAPLVKSHFAGRPRLYLMDPPLIQDALVRHADDIAKGRDIRRTLGPALGEGLLTAEGAHWRWQRRAAAPAFAPGRLGAFLPAMAAAAEAAAERWAAMGSGARLDLGHETATATFDVITRTVLPGDGALDPAAVERGLADYLGPLGWVLAISLLGLPRSTPYPGRRKAMAAASGLRAAIVAAVARRRTAPADPSDLLSLLLAAADPETGRALSDRELADNVATFIVAGHETTANGLAWALRLLAAHPEAEARVVAEVRAVAGGGPVRAEHVERLAFTRAAFEEALRLYPPAPIITRLALRPFALGPARVEAGMALIVPIVALHRHRGLWDEPERFDPGRFLPERSRARHRYSFMPFGAGPRMCIGAGFAVLEATAILAVLLRRFRLEALGPIPRPTMGVTLRPATPILMRLRPRD